MFATECAVRVENLSFGYSRNKNVLNNLSMEIEKGKISALLGSNGCGKTTLLKLILGRAKPKKGTIQVFGPSSSHKCSYICGPSVGYMPQEIALGPEFTIEENVLYFAKLFHLSSQEFKERFEYLTQLLHLEQKNRRIDQLSGGEQRLVSMAVVLLHKPKLMILDEPTVGVDPIIRSNIWSYLVDTCSNHGNTVIITTHYIEEAKRASTVAFMKSGAILIQANPQKLMYEYQCTSLEEVYLRLWDESDHKPNDWPRIKRGSQQTSKINETDLINLQKIVDISRVMALIWKFNLRVKKFLLIIFCMLLLPLLTLFSLYLAVGHLPHNIPVAVHSEESQPSLSHDFFNSIDAKLLAVTQYKSKELIIDSITNGKTAFALSFDKNFTNDLESRLLEPFSLSAEQLDNSQIKLFTDNTRAVILWMGLQYLAQVFQQFVTNVSISLNLNPNAFALPVTIEQPIYGVHPITGEDKDKYRANYHYLAPGFLLTTVHMLSMVFSALAIIIYRKHQQLDRFFASGGQPIEVIISHYISNAIFATFQVLVMLISSSLLFDLKQEGSYVQVYLICFAQSLQGVSVGLLVALFFKKQESIGIVLCALMLPSYYISGLYWPLEGIPSRYRVFAEWTLISKPIDSLRSMMLRGWDYTHPNVMIGFVVSLSYTLLTSIMNVILFQVSQDGLF